MYGKDARVRVQDDNQGQQRGLCADAATMAVCDAGVQQQLLLKLHQHAHPHCLWNWRMHMTTRRPCARKTPTVRRPNSVPARNTLMAISPRFAAMILLNGTSPVCEVCTRRQGQQHRQERGVKGCSPSLAAETAAAATRCCDSTDPVAFLLPCSPRDRHCGTPGSPPPCLCCGKCVLAAAVLPGQPFLVPILLLLLLTPMVCSGVAAFAGVDMVCMGH